MGGWSRAIARQFVTWIDVGPRKSWLDIGCGTGALTQSIFDLVEPSRMVGVDPSNAFVQRARERISDARADFEVADAQALPSNLGDFDAVVSGLVLNFIPDPDAALEQMVKATRLGGIVGAYVWDYTDRMELMRYFWDAATELDPAAQELDEGRWASLCNPDALAALFSQGLTSVEVSAFEVPTVFKTFDEYWSPFLGGIGPAPAYAVSLTPQRREALRERLRQRLPIAEDGSVSLTARAWAVKGRRRFT